MEFLDCTSLTLDEFPQLVPPFETAFHARMAAWRMDGQPRTMRRFTVYTNCPLPTPEDRLLFILVYELVASFANRSNLLKAQEKTDLCAIRTAGARGPKNTAITRIPTHALPQSGTHFSDRTACL
jgi:hypothetical protein